MTSGCGDSSVNPSTESGPLTVVQKLYKEFANGSLPGVIALHSEDAVWYVGQGERTEKREQTAVEQTVSSL